MKREANIENRTPDPNDILGYVYVSHGRIIENTYKRNEMHRMETPDGKCQVTEYIQRIAEKEVSTR